MRAALCVVSMPVLSVLASLTLVGCESSEPSASRRGQAREPRLEPAAEQIVLVDARGGTARLRLRADRILRKRRHSIGGLLVYQNLSELRLANAAIDLRLDRVDATDAGLLLADNFAVLGDVGSSGRASTSRPEQADVDTDLLTRVVLEPVALRVAYPHGSLLLCARTGRLELGERALTLDDVVLVDAIGRFFHARIAVLGHEEGTIYLPRGYAAEDTGGSEEPSQAVLNERGEIETKPCDCPAVTGDPIQALEGLLLGTLMDGEGSVPGGVLSVLRLALLRLAEQGSCPDGSCATSLAPRWNPGSCRDPWGLASRSEAGEAPL